MVANIGVNIYEYYGLYAIAIIELVIFGSYYFSLRKNVPEMLVLNKARKKRVPIVEIGDATGNSFWATMNLEKKENPIIKDDDSVFINPKSGTLQVPDRLGGTPVYRFNAHWTFPLTQKNAKAFYDVIRYVRLNYKEFDFLDDLEIMVLINTTKNELLLDCEKLMATHPESTITAEILSDLIKTIQEKLKEQPIKSGFFTYHYAFKLIPTATTAGDFRQLKQYLERLAAINSGAQFQKFLQYAIFIMVILIGAGFGYGMINK